MVFLFLRFRESAYIMKKILAYPLTVIYYFFFGLTLLVFHPIQVLCLRVFGYEAHKQSVAILNFFLIRCLHLLGTRFSFEDKHEIALNQPVIIVSNHQGTYDIPPIIWFLRRLHPKFISKKELGKGIPSVSYNLRHGGSALIDRKDRRQSITAIKNLTSYLNETHRSVVIFPEGTRSKDGIPKAFATGGLRTLFEAMPTAMILPITVHNSWKLGRWGGFPMDIGVHIKHKTHAPIAVNSMPTDQLIKHVEQIVLADFKVINRRK